MLEGPTPFKLGFISGAEGFFWLLRHSVKKALSFILLPTWSRKLSHLTLMQRRKEAVFLFSDGASVEGYDFYHTTGLWDLWTSITKTHLTFYGICEHLGSHISTLSNFVMFENFKIRVGKRKTRKIKITVRWNRGPYTLTWLFSNLRFSKRQRHKIFAKR